MAALLPLNSAAKLPLTLETRLFGQYWALLKIPT